MSHASQDQRRTQTPEGEQQHARTGSIKHGKAKDRSGHTTDDASYLNSEHTDSGKGAGSASRATFGFATARTTATAAAVIARAPAGPCGIAATATPTATPASAPADAPAPTPAQAYPSSNSHPSGDGDAAEIIRHEPRRSYRDRRRWLCEHDLTSALSISFLE